ncbi:MAG TPA: carboxypeptidase-like regulatory domain-containing protein [Candidatus Tectomicrobia bacterium]|jgi:hypothetical protein
MEEVRHQVAIAGRVTDAQTGKPITGAQVSITTAPAAFKAQLASIAGQHGARWDSMVERPDRHRTAADGQFRFLDLPNGQYTVTASLQRAGSRYGTARVRVRVARSAHGNVTMAVVNLALPPTTLQGRITDQAADPVVMAEVRVQGSRKRAFSDGEGQYLLTGLEVGAHTVLVAAQGYTPVTQTVRLNRAGTVRTVNFTLVPTTP